MHLLLLGETPAASLCVPILSPGTLKGQAEYSQQHVPSGDLLRAPGTPPQVPPRHPGNPHPLHTLSQRLDFQNVSSMVAQDLEEMVSTLLRCPGFGSPTGWPASLKWSILGLLRVPGQNCGSREHSQLLTATCPFPFLALALSSLQGPHVNPSLHLQTPDTTHKQPGGVPTSKAVCALRKALGGGLHRPGCGLGVWGREF